MKDGQHKNKHGSIFYTLDGKYHRDGAPAFECVQFKAWYQHGKEHREDGAAVEYASGIKYWYLHGKLLTCSTQEEFEQLMRLRAFW